jgi:hypothetical protein
LRLRFSLFWNWTILTLNLDAYVKKFRDLIAEIVKRYVELARDADKCRTVCLTPIGSYGDPFSKGRRYRIAALTEEALRKLLDTWFEAIPLNTQYVLRSPDRSVATLRTLAKGRVRSHRTFTAGTPTKPLKRNWTFTTQRAIYIDFVKQHDGSLECYVGKATASKRAIYLGMDGRCKSYLADRRRGSTKARLTDHLRALIEPRNRPFLRKAASFYKDVPLQMILPLEDVLTMYMRSMPLGVQTMVVARTRCASSLSTGMLFLHIS